MGRIRTRLLLGTVALTLVVVTVMVAVENWGQPKSVVEFAGLVVFRWGAITAAVTLAGVAFDRWLWKIPLVNAWCGGRPILHGTWTARLQFVRGAGAQGLPEMYPVYMVVRQTFFSTSMRLHSATSQSRLRVGEIVHNADGTYSFLAIYLATPHIAARIEGGLHIHRGAMMLAIQMKPYRGLLSPGEVVSMVGEFWTDRGVLGTVELIQHRGECFADFRSARANDVAADAIECEAAQAAAALAPAALAPAAPAALAPAAPAVQVPAAAAANPPV